MSLRTVLLVRTALLITLVLFLGCHASLAAPGTECAAKQQAVDAARARIKADQKSILRLNAGITVEDLEKWVEESTKERREVVEDSLVSGLGMVAEVLSSSTKLAEDALKPMSIAGVNLPHGVGSLGTGQANQIIGRLQRFGSGSPQVQTLIENVRTLRSFQNKTDTLEFAAQVHKFASAFKASSGAAKEVADLSSGDTVKVWAVYLQLFSGLAGKGASVPVEVGKALFEAGEHLTEAFLISSIINNTLNPIQSQPLSDPRYEVQESQGTVKATPYQPTGKDVTEGQLAALKVLSQRLERDVELLHRDQDALTNCLQVPAVRYSRPFLAHGKHLLPFVGSTLLLS